MTNDKYKFYEVFWLISEPLQQSFEVRKKWSMLHFLCSLNLISKLYFLANLNSRYAGLSSFFYLKNKFFNGKITTRQLKKRYFCDLNRVFRLGSQKYHNTQGLLCKINVK
jgi:hypothetical protein